MELSQNARKTLSLVFQNAADQSAIKLSEITRKSWSVRDAQINSSPKDLFPAISNNAKGNHYGAFFLIPGGTVLLAFPEKSLQEIVGVFFADKHQWAKSIPNWNKSVASEISNVTVNKFIGVLADSCQMGFVVSPPEMLRGDKQKLFQDVIVRTSQSHDNLAIAGHVEMHCAALSADCSMVILLDSAITSRMLQSLNVIYLSTFLNYLVSEISWPLIPLFALTLGATGSQVGWLNSCPILLSLLTAFMTGQISDRLGRRPVLLFGAGVRALSMLCIGFAQNLPSLCVGWTFDGAQNSLDTANAYVSDVTLKNERFQKMTFLGIAAKLPEIIGPLIAGWLAMAGFSSAFFFCSCLALLNLLLLYKQLPESRFSDLTTSPLDLFNFTTMKKLLSNRQIRLLIAVSFLLWFSIFSIYQTFVLYAAQYLSYSTREIGYILSFIGLISVIFRYLPAEGLVNRFGEIIPLFLGILLMGAGAGLIPSSQKLWAILTATGFIAAGIPLATACLSVLLSFNTSSNTQGAVYGLDSTFSGLGAIAGMLTSGLLYDRLSPMAPFFVVCVLLTFGLLFCSRLEVIPKQYFWDKENFV